MRRWCSRVPAGSHVALVVLVVFCLLQSVTCCEKYKCSNGRTPVQNPQNRPTSNGCGPSWGNVDLKKCPQVTLCCNQHDVCFSTCGTTQSDCDARFKSCLQNLSNGPCKGYGNLLDFLVNLGGCFFFTSAQKRHCLC